MSGKRMKTESSEEESSSDDDSSVGEIGDECSVSSGEFDEEPIHELHLDKRWNLMDPSSWCSLETFVVKRQKGNKVLITIHSDFIERTPALPPPNVWSGKKTFDLAKNGYKQVVDFRQRLQTDIQEFVSDPVFYALIWLEEGNKELKEKNNTEANLITEYEMRTTCDAIEQFLRDPLTNSQLHFVDEDIPNQQKRYTFVFGAQRNKKKHGFNWKYPFVKMLLHKIISVFNKVTVIDENNLKDAKLFEEQFRSMLRDARDAGPMSQAYRRLAWFVCISILKGKTQEEDVYDEYKFVDEAKISNGVDDGESSAIF